MRGIHGVHLKHVSLMLYEKEVITLKKKLEEIQTSSNQAGRNQRDGFT